MLGKITNSRRRYFTCGVLILNIATRTIMYEKLGSKESKVCYAPLLLSIDAITAI